MKPIVFSQPRRHPLLRRLRKLLLAVALMFAFPAAIFAKGYSSGGGHSYSSGSSSSASHSSSSASHSSSSSSHSSGFGGSSSSSSHSSGFSSSSGKTYGSGSSSSSSAGHSYGSGGSQNSGYSSGKSYSSGIGHAFSSPGSDSSSSPSRPRTFNSPDSSPAPTGIPFDSGAARASQEAASKRSFNQYQQTQAARSDAPTDNGGFRSTTATGPPNNPRSVPPVIPRSPPVVPGGSYAGSYRQNTTWYPDPQMYSTRPIRLQSYFTPYWSRPVVVYNDNYNSYFWWWLLDQSLENRAQWAYHHRADMDDARYRAMVYKDLALENRVLELEQRQVPRDPNFVPAGMDRDLMYTDNYVERAYTTWPTTGGRIGFFILLVPVILGVGAFFTWFVFFKRWQTSTA